MQAYNCGLLGGHRRQGSSREPELLGVEKGSTEPERGGGFGY